MRDEVVWTDEGRATLASLRRHSVFLHTGADDASLNAHVAASITRFTPLWQRGLAFAGPFGHAAVVWTHARLATGALPDDVTPHQAAWAVTLIGGYADVVDQLCELVVRRGPAFAVDALIATRSMRIVRHAPRGSRGEDDDAIWVDGADPPTELDAPTGLGLQYDHGKERLSYYLAQVTDHGDEATRAALRAAVAERWHAASARARSSLAIATDDAERAAEVTRAALDDGGPSWRAPGEVFYLLRDAALARRAFRPGTSLDQRVIANLGAAALPLFERALAANDYATGLRALYDLRGPRTARIFGRFAERRPYAALVHNYFADSPELLLGLRRNRSMEPYRLQLHKLESRLRIAHDPTPPRPRSPRPARRP